VPSPQGSSTIVRAWVPDEVWSAVVELRPAAAAVVWAEGAAPPDNLTPRAGPGPQQQHMRSQTGLGLGAPGVERVIFEKDK
jgi:hypothetical protein